MMQLPRGSNVQISRLLTLSDGVTALPVSSLAAATVELMQTGVIDTAALGTNASLHGTGTANELVYEITSAVTLKLQPGLTVVLRWTLTLLDASFVAEPGKQICVLSEVIATAA